MLVAGTPTHGIVYLDGVRLHRALMAVIRRVLAHQEALKRINVFPVADTTSGRINPHTGPGSLVVAVQPFDPPGAGGPEGETT